MNKVILGWFLLVSALLPLTISAQDVPPEQLQTPGKLTVSFETTAPAGGKYANKNIHVVWIENADGKFVKTLNLWANKRAKHLALWAAAAADRAKDIQARTGATLTAYGMYTSTWDGTDASGKLMPDGNYVIRLELTNDNANKNKFHRASIPFCKTSQPNVIGVPGEGGYKQILLSWQPGETKNPTSKSSDTSIQKDPNMILDQISSAQMYGQFTRRITQGLALLNEESVLNAPLGKHEVQGQDIFFSVDEYQTKPFEEGRPEIHQKYLDIQYIVSGTECIGFSPLEGLQVDQPYDSQKDIAFYKYAPGMSKLVLKPGMFVIFWPNEPHMPCRAVESPTAVRKIVVKVRME